MSRKRFLVKAITSSKMLMFVCTPIIIMNTVAGTFVPFATGAFIDAVIAHDCITVPFAVFAALSIFRLLMGPLSQRLILSRSRTIELEVQRSVLEKSVSLSPMSLAEYPDGEMVAKLARDASSIGSFVRGLYPRFVSAVVMMIVAGITLYSKSHAVGIAFVLFVPISMLVFWPFGGRFANNSHRVRKQGDVSFNALFEFFRILPFVKSLGAERRMEMTPKDALANLKKSNDRTDSLTTSFGVLMSMILTIGEIVVLGVSGYMAWMGTIPIGDIVVYQMLFIMAVQSVQGIVTLLPEVAAIREGAESICEILSHETDVRGCESVGRIMEIEFKNVTFAYPKSPRPVVENFSAVFRAGTVVGLVGENGAGKTTILKLAMGALVPQSGEVLINGKPLGTLEPDEFRSRLSAVFQDNLLFSGTIRENVTLLDCGFTGENIKNAAKEAGLDTVVSRLNDRYNTRIGYRGQSLSGGECQRLAIARAIIRNPDVLILDEVTNHLDADACASFRQLVTNLKENKIVLMVSHDAETLKMCDLKISCQMNK